MANGSGTDVKKPKRYDLSGKELPYVGGDLGPSAPQQPPVVVQFPTNLQPSEGSPEFIVAYSLVAPAGATTALFTLDGANNVTNGAALKLPENARARISGVVLEGDTILGAPILQFFIGADTVGQKKLGGWAGVNLPGRGGIVAIGIEPFTIVSPGSFFGGFVKNTDAGPHYAAMIIQGWLY
jgi:hypothetical protein